LDFINDEWYIVDGDGTKKSTNGTWFFIEQPFEIYDNMIFKAGLLVFKAYFHK